MTRSATSPSSSDTTNTSPFVVMACKGLGAALLSELIALLKAQPERWPTWPIRLVVPYVAGGTTDLLASVVADWPGGRLSRPIVVENRGGAGATIGAAAASQVPPDRYALIISNSGSHDISPHIYPNPGYDPLHDFTHIALIAQTLHVLLVHPAHPAGSLSGFVEAARWAEEMRFAVSGIGASSHLLDVRLGLAIGIPVEPVAYRGSSPAAADVIAGVVSAMFDSVPSGVGHVRPGSLRALATSSTARSATLPAVPTLREAGADIVSASWFGLSAPRILPKPVSRRLATAGRLTLLGSELPAGTAEDYPGFVETELQVWGPIVCAAGVRL